jgi:purine-binding chemotaxis protein CheW
LDPAASSSELTLLFRVHASASSAEVTKASGGATAVATLYGCAIGDAQEIVPLRPMTRLPGAPPYVRGLINLRGLIVTVLDLACRLDPSRPLTQRGAIVLVRDRGGANGGRGAARESERLVGIVVDEVADVRALEIHADDAAASGGIVRGIATLDDGPVVVLDLVALVRQVLLS